MLGLGQCHGPATLSQRTGQYAGIGGTLRVSGTFAEIGPRLKNGKCNMRQNAKPLAGFNAVTLETIPCRDFTVAGQGGLL